MPKTYYVGIKGLIISDNKAFILKSKNYNYWDLPGGRMDEGEEITDTLLRELKEELINIQDIQIHNLIHVFKYPSKLNDGQELVLLIYKVTANLSKVVLSNEHKEYRWISKMDLSNIADEASLNEEYKNILYQNL